jgi:hypothetical protein
MQTIFYRLAIAGILLFIAGLVLADILFITRAPERQLQPQTTINPAPERQPQLQTTINPDCGWLVAISVWIDSNRNGVHEDGELPMPNVKLYYASSYLTRDRTESLPYVSDSSGQAKINVFPTGCFSHTYDVYPEVPSGYTVTTPLILRLTAPNSDFEQVGFGFAFDVPK